MRLYKLWPHAKSKGHYIGEIRRVGYYSRQDGLDCIWLVNEAGEYDWTVDHDFLNAHFEILDTSEEEDYYGEERLALGPVTPKN